MTGTPTKPPFFKRFLLTSGQIRVFIIIMVLCSVSAKFDFTKWTTVPVYSWDEFKKRLPDRLYGGIGICLFIYVFKITGVLGRKRLGRPDTVMCMRCKKTKPNDDNYICSCGGKFDDPRMDFSKPAPENTSVPAAEPVDEKAMKPVTSD